MKVRDLEIGDAFREGRNATKGTVRIVEDLRLCSTERNNWHIRYSGGHWCISQEADVTLANRKEA